MSAQSGLLSRRDFLTAASAGGLAMMAAGPLSAGYRPETELAADDRVALIGMTLDLEMSMHYPSWGIMEWNYIKGLLNDETKQYAREACRRVKAKGGVIHSFMLGRTLEQADVTWLEEIVKEGHPVGNHTYDHVNVWAVAPGTKPESVQFRFQREPALVAGKTAKEIVRENIQATTAAMKRRLGKEPDGFRTPGGSLSGLDGRADVQQMLLDLGFWWVSSRAPHVPIAPENPTAADFQRVVDRQTDAQPYVYPTGLVEVPMSPLGDVASFRREKQKWKIGDFLTMIEKCVGWAIENHAVFDLLTHPSIMYVEDPKFQSYELICDMVQASGGKAAIVGLDVIAERAKRRQTPPPKT